MEIWSWKHETIKLSKLETIKDLVRKHNLECKLLECANKQYQSELKDLQERFDNEIERGWLVHSLFGNIKTLFVIFLVL